MAKMPHLVEMDKRYAKKGLKLIGAHVQSATEEQILEVLKDKKVEFSVTDGANGPVQVSGIPHMVVFDVDGKLVYSGYPSDDADDIIKKELRRVTAAGDGAAGDGKSGIFGSTSAKSEDVLVAERNWTNTDGNTMTATLLAVDGANAKFRRADGKEFTYSVAKLSEADQELIREAQEKATSGDSEAEGLDDEPAEEEAADDPIGFGT